MKKPFALLTCSAFALSGCQMISETHNIDTKTTYSDLWTSAEVAADERIHSAPQTVNPDTDPNRIPTSKTESGNREYLFADSIKQENGKVMALIEYRYAQTQKLPSNGLPYTHNHWFEEIDCANKIRTVRTTTHYNAQGEIVDANEYPAPKLSPAQMKLLAQPDDGVIKEVCQRVGGAPTVSGSPENNPASHTPSVSGNAENPTATQTPTVSGSPDNQPATQTPTVSGSPTNQNRDNADTAPAPQAASEAVAAPPATENEAQTNSKNKRNKKDKIKNTPAKNETNPADTVPQVDFVKQSKQQNQADTQPEKPSETQPAATALPLEMSNDDEIAPIQPKQQHDDLPADFWTIGAPQE